METAVTPSVDRVAHMTFNTPLTPLTEPDGGTYQCGRVVFSDFHVDNGGHGDFPGYCGSPTLTPKEEALVFMLFDVSSCVQNDQQAPSVCPGLGQACSTSNPCCSGLICTTGTCGPPPI
jgi:hypothetical protein